MRIVFLLIIWMFMVQLLCGQSNIKTDSLLQVLRLTHESRAKTRLLLKLSKEEELRDPEKAIHYALQARQRAQIAGFDSAEVRAMILLGVNYITMMQLKEAIEIGEQIIEKASRYNMKLEIADGRGIMAVAYAQGGDFDNSSKLYFENLKLYEKLNENRLLAGTMGNIGVDFIEQQNYEKAIEYINKALNVGLKINDMTLMTDQYNNLAAIYFTGIHDLPKALQYFFKSLELAKKIEDFHLQGLNMLNIGHVYMEMNNMDSSKFYFDNALIIFQKLNNPVLIADCYIALGSYYYHVVNYTKSKNLALLGLNIGEEYGKLQTIFDASELLHKICLSTSDTSGSYKYLVIRTNAHDSLNTLQNQKDLFKIEFQYHQEKILKEQKLRQLRNYFILGSIIFGLLSGLAIIFLFYSRQKIKIKNTLLEMEKAEFDLKFKSKELSINLMALLKKNELIAEISQKLSCLEKESSKIDLKDSLQKLNHDIKQSSDDRLWQEFSVQFKETNSDFYNKLLKAYPDLTHSELKLCAYLRLNMTTKEIADLTGQSIETLGKARYRLRKKFGLTNSESNLVTFLTQI